jgi:UDP-glucuronate decarboxylase
MQDEQPCTRTILIPGGAGFLGSHLAEALLKLNHRIICLDNLSTGSLSNLTPLQGESQLDFIEADIAKPLPPLPKLDLILNLACPASPAHYQKDPIQTWKTSVFGAYHLLELARDRTIPILQASTSEVYGDPLEHPQKETYWGHVNSVGPRSCYDEGKRAAESLFFDYLRAYHLPIKVIRIFNTYGPRMDAQDGRVVSNFILQALRGQPLTLYGRGEQTRSFCYVDDLIDGIVRFIHFKGLTPGPLNLGNPSEYSILELAKLTLSLTQSSSLLSFKPLPTDDPRQRRPDIQKAQDLLQWSPQTSLQEGLTKTITYFQNLLHTAIPQDTQMNSKFGNLTRR